MAGAMLFERAQAVSMTNRSEGISLLNEIVSDPNIGVTEDDEDNIRVKEQGILHLGELYKKEGKAKELAELIKATRPFLSLISKAKAAKLVRSLVDFFLDLEAGIGIEVQLCKECIEWAKEERRTFLRQSLEARLIALYFDTGMYSEALQLGSALLKELKKLDDKQLLVEVQLLESKTYHALSNLAKARAALTSARTTANAIYCPPKMQAALDLQSGILHAADERDFKTAYSYFYEAFEGYDSVESPKALTALKYMLLSKIMLRTPEDVQSIMSGKLAVKYAGKDLDAMRAVAEASHRRSLAEFQTAVKKYREELEDDVIVRAHLGSLYDAMLEQNLCRLVEPYSRVQVQEYKDSLKTKAEQLLIKGFPEKIVKLNKLLETPGFCNRKLSDVHQDLNVPIPDPIILNHSEHETASKKRKADNNIDNASGTKVMVLPSGPVPCNKPLCDLILIVKPYIRQLLEDSNLLKMWISYLIPKIEDGNNFGVSIQEDTLAEIQSVESEAAAFFDQISRYFISRGKIISKVAKYPHISDYRRAVQELDEKEYVSLWLVMCEVRNRYCSLHDLVIKNLEKIKKPRSSNSQSLY